MSNKSKRSFYLIFLIALWIIYLCSGCQPRLVPISSERIVKDSTIIREIPVLVEVPGAIIQSPIINIDSLVNLLRSGVDPKVIERTLIREDPATGLRVGLLIDRLGNLTALCEQQDRMIQVLQKEIERHITDKKVIVSELKKSRLEEFWDDVALLAGIFGLIAAFFIGVKIISKLL